MYTVLLTDPFDDYLKSFDDRISAIDFIIDELDPDKRSDNLAVSATLYHDAYYTTWSVFVPATEDVYC